MCRMRFLEFEQDSLLPPPGNRRMARRACPRAISDVATSKLGLKSGAAGVLVKPSKHLAQKNIVHAVHEWTLDLHIVFEAKHKTAGEIGFAANG